MLITINRSDLLMAVIGLVNVFTFTLLCLNIPPFKYERLRADVILSTVNEINKSKVYLPIVILSNYISNDETKNAKSKSALSN